MSKEIVEQLKNQRVAVFQSGSDKKTGNNGGVVSKKNATNEKSSEITEIKVNKKSKATRYNKPDNPYAKVSRLDSQEANDLLNTLNIKPTKELSVKDVMQGSNISQAEIRQTRSNTSGIDGVKTSVVGRGDNSRELTMF